MKIVCRQIVVHIVATHYPPKIYGHQSGADLYFSIQ